MLGLLVVIFYFLLIRPQQKRLKQHQALVASLAPGDDVVTIGGLFGRVTSINDDEVMLEVSEGTVVRVSRQAVSKKIEAQTEVEPTE